MSNRVVITIEVPDGVTPTVDYQTVPRPQQQATLPVTWTCPEHGNQKIRTWPDGGISCGVQGGSNVNDKGYCKYRAKRGQQAPVQEPPPPAEDFDSLPF